MLPYAYWSLGQACCPATPAPVRDGCSSRAHAELMISTWRSITPISFHSLIFSPTPATAVYEQTCVWTPCALLGLPIAVCMPLQSSVSCERRLLPCPPPRPSSLSAHSATSYELCTRLPDSSPTASSPRGRGLARPRQRHLARGPSRTRAPLGHWTKLMFTFVLSPAPPPTRQATFC